MAQIRDAKIGAKQSEISKLFLDLMQEVDYRGVWCRHAILLQDRATSSQEIPEMRLTRECDYAFVVLVYLAAQERTRVISCDELADLLSIPYEFLAKILQKLSRAGFIGSKQGPHGGYYLARNPSEITFSDVFHAIDDPVRLVECVEVESCRCPRLSVCAIIETMRALHQKVMAEFDRATVADLIPLSREASPVHARAASDPLSPR